MTLLQLVVLAIVQGVTEFLPVSSSGHLILTWAAFEQAGHTLPPANAQLAIDVAVHVGTLGAVMAYMWREIGQILLGLWRGLRGKSDPGQKLLGLVIVATIPVIAAGFLMKEYFGGNIRSVEVTAWAFIGFGLLLFAADKMSLTVRQMDHMGFGAAAYIGLAQVLALIPGTSRAGITMTAARSLGYERRDAARFSMLLAIPAIAGAGALLGHDVYKAGDVRLGQDAILAAAIAFVTAFVAIALMMAWLKRASFTPFVIYRVLFGIFLLLWVYGAFSGWLPAPKRL